MRPYLLFCTLVLVARMAFGQQEVPRVYGGGYGFGPYAPLLSTPTISFETASPNSVGASNATTGLEAGATNSTVSQIEGSTNSSYSGSVWYQGGSPMTSSDVNVSPEPIGQEAHRTGEFMGEGPSEDDAREAKGTQWEYFSAPEYTTSLTTVAKGPGPGKHTYINNDVTRQNDQNGAVKYNGKNEKLQ